jgi:two-component system, cell cycle response regulator DivK
MHNSADERELEGAQRTTATAHGRRVVEANVAEKQVTEGNLKPLVLIAEDHQDIRTLTKLFLELEGCCAVEAANGLEALRIALTLKLDLIVMDIDMPIMDGLEATRCLRQNDSTRRVPIVAVTGHNNQRRQEAIEAGCNEFLQKPLMITTLRDVLARYLNSDLNQRVA